jgi:hypothetical protein
MYYPETEIQSIEDTFSEYTQREDIAILLINQHVRLPFAPLRLSNFIDIDCGENPTHCGQISTSFSSFARNTVKGPPLWCVLALVDAIHQINID